ncbi:MAG: DUF4136 domain-containing protein [Gemmatimonadaceae bacterium]
MRSTFQRALCASLAFAITGCAPSISVRTMTAPEAGLEQLHMFRVLPGPARRDGRPVTGADDPMINNSIANRAIREQITQAFHARGYGLDELRPDFVVAFYASSREKLDVTVWDYGYPFHPGWPRYDRSRQSVTQYSEGTVIVDVLNPRTRLLLWRGEGTAELSNDPNENLKQLAKVANKIIAKFPRAKTSLVAVRR